MASAYYPQATPYQCGFVVYDVFMNTLSNKELVEGLRYEVHRLTKDDRIMNWVKGYYYAQQEFGVYLSDIKVSELMYSERLELYRRAAVFYNKNKRLDWYMEKLGI